MTQIQLPVQTTLELNPDEVDTIATVGDPVKKGERFIRWQKRFVLTLKNGSNYNLDYATGRWLLKHLQTEWGKVFNRVRKYQTSEKVNRKGETYEHKEVFWVYKLMN